MHLLTSLLLSHLASATAISLSSFTPRIDNLPSACRAVYTSPIDGCAPTDFATGATCSVQCLAGLVRIGVSVKSGCQSVDVGETSIIGVFQNGLGSAALCPNNKQPSSTTTAAASQTPTSTGMSSALKTSTRTTAQATTAVASSSTAAASSSGGIAVDSSATQVASTSFHFNDPTAVPTSTGTPAGNSQLSNSDSGGGSPFDVVATGAAGRLQGTKLALCVAAAVLFAGCL